MKSSSRRTLTALIGTTALCAVLGTTAAAAQPTVPSTAQRLPKVVTAWAAAWNGSDPQALGVLFTADSTYTDQGIGVTFHGRQEIGGWKARTDSLIDGVHVTVKAAHRDGAHITVEAVYSGHLKGAPKPFAVPMATLLDLGEHHLIASDQDYYSLNTVLAQSGLPADWTPPTH
ncbi:nuclear transport factor 2 family protein [Kitasatospora sp. NBC_00240]|uniref:nuclear transport factor 2 family protein n=1 Tax=Kitasatospora sp. NBC_00240 TaxID=2903567 RepID=UPI002254B0C1|nr:nuclear transport factor 2 family protein [Kitasatospora sp. NBC_00240]MCX5212578.1 nuclear transport factor 2 family protein [Kitasatospora sp. NBC_00240]